MIVVLLMNILTMILNNIVSMLNAPATFIHSACNQTLYIQVFLLQAAHKIALSCSSCLGNANQL